MTRMLSAQEEWALEALQAAFKCLEEAIDDRTYYRVSDAVHDAGYDPRKPESGAVHAYSATVKNSLESILTELHRQTATPMTGDVDRDSLIKEKAGTGITLLNAGLSALGYVVIRPKSPTGTVHVYPPYLEVAAVPTEVRCGEH